MFKSAKLPQDWSVTQPYFECDIWILSVMRTASYNQKTLVILTLIQFCFLLHRRNFCHKGRELTLFQADAQYKALEGEYTLH